MNRQSIIASSATAIRPRARRSRARRRIMLLAIGVVAAVSWALPAQANPLVCATVSYSTFGGPDQYVLNNECFVPTPWGTAGGSGPFCAGVNPYVAACYKVVVSGP